MTYENAPGECKTQCDFNFTSNGTADHRCTTCDISCNGCEDNGIATNDPPDTVRCLECSESHPFRVEDKDGPQKICLNTCKQGIYDKVLFQ